MFSPIRVAYSSRTPAGSSSVSVGNTGTADDLRELDDALSRIEEIVRIHASVQENLDETLPAKKKRDRNAAKAEVRKHMRGGGPEGGVDASDEAVIEEEGRGGRPLHACVASKFVTFSPSHEEEMVELLRRTAEIVIQGEKRASAITDSRALLDNEGEEGGTDLQEGNVQEDENKDREREAYSALFNRFVERNVLGLIVSVVSGSAFEGLKMEAFSEPISEQEQCENLRASDPICSEAHGKDEQGEGTKSDEPHGKTGCTCVFLPPISVATQAVQSMAILFQNVCLATSLYMLLSNNLINDLIALPLSLYAEAEALATCEEEGDEEDGVGSRGGGAISGTRVAWDSGEMSELATHFVSFLKSLAMRINPETLQFYLRYPPKAKGLVTLTGAAGGDGECDNANITGPQLANQGQAKKVDEVDFPLYARALEFCSAGQDSFVRVTAMNICLNMLRLATGGGNEVSSLPSAGEKVALEQRDENRTQVKDFTKETRAEQMDLNDRGCEDNTSGLHGGENFTTQAPGETAEELQDNSTQAVAGDRVTGKENGDTDIEDSAQLSSPNRPNSKRRSSSKLLSTGERITSLRDLMKSPDATLVSVDLPFRDRVAIANHICYPERVQRFVGPIFVKLVHLCGALEEEIEALDKDMEEAATDEMKEEEEDYDEAMQRHMESVHSIAADMQDEFLLLDDVFKLGLRALNEQIIEMMLATFVYPMLLQPLLLCVRRKRKDSVTGSAFTRGESNGAESVNRSGATSRRSSIGSDAGSECGRPVDIPSRSESISKILSSRPNHPFTLDSISTSLRESGLLGDTEKLMTEVGNGQSIDPVSFLQKNMEALQDQGSLEAGPTLAPAKTALFGLFSVFSTVTNRPLLRLLFAALFHPDAPDGLRGDFFTTRPNVFSIGKDGKPCIGIDLSSQSVSTSAAMYRFGRLNTQQRKATTAGDDTTKSEASLVADDKKDQCIFVLAPALASVLEDERGLEKSANTYRHIMLSFLAGNDEQGQKHGLQGIAVLAFDAAVSALQESKDDILFGPGVCTSETVLRGDEESTAKVETLPSDRPLFCQDDSSDAIGTPKEQSEKGVGAYEDASALFGAKISFSADRILEVVAALCVRVMSATVCVNGVWRVDYDFTAAHALVKVTSGNSIARVKAKKLVNHRLRQSASFLIQLPSLVWVDNPQAIEGDDGQPKVIMEDQDQHQLDLIIDRIFRDDIDGEESRIINQLHRYCGEERKDSFMLEVAKQSSLKETCDQLCRENITHTTVLVSESKNAALSCAAASALAHLRLDALSNVIEKEYFPACAGSDATKQKSNSSFDASSVEDEMIMSPLSSTLVSYLCDEKEEDTMQNYPKPGAVVRLVGRIAFPCVCEVTETSASLFTDGRACVVADGVRWQSLYLVFIGRYMLLAEPVKTGSGGNGRIVTSCLLACLTVSNESFSPARGSAASTASRLVVRHRSFDSVPPGVFVLEEKADARCGVASEHSLDFRSRMDLWFEDGASAANAYNTFSAKIAKARSKRGRRLREVLERMSS